MTGRVEFCFIGIPSAISFIKNGQLLPLAVSMTKRSPALPDVPTTIELGFADPNYVFWNGTCWRRQKRHARLSTGCTTRCKRCWHSPDVQAKLKAQGVEPMPLSPREIDTMIAKEIVQNINLAKAAGLEVQLSSGEFKIRRR